MDIVERLRFDAARCEMHFSKGVATNIEEAANEIERIRARTDAAIRILCNTSLPPQSRVNDANAILAR